MTSFDRILLRLKEQLGVQTDKEVAALLGMSTTAFNARKKRDAFPQDKLLAMLMRRQDINIDEEYVLTGSSAAAQEFDRRLAAVRHGAAVLDEVARAEIGTLAKDEQQLVGHYRRSSDKGRTAILATVAAIADVSPRESPSAKPTRKPRTKA